MWFASPEACRRAVDAGQRLPRQAGTARFASWNLRWFPDGEPGEGQGDADPTWLACAIAWLDADVVAIQEVKQSPRARRALDALLAQLGSASGGRWVARLDDCGGRVQQHVGLLWNESRVSASVVETVAALNPQGDACRDQLRPGLAARLRLPGGLDLTVVSAHLKSKTDPRAFGLRRKSFAAMPGAFTDLAMRAADTDVLLLGDLNTMGCDACDPPVSATQEQAQVSRELGRAGFTLVPADAAGSELSSGKLSLLDHAVASRSMRELPPGSRAHLAGACEIGSSSALRRAARRGLSDHCPLVLDLTDRDLD
jgi:endonuclease/exonuclease/phosphatase family metal-dependent hydrolase